MRPVPKYKGKKLSAEQLARVLRQYLAQHPHTADIHANRATITVQVYVDKKLYSDDDTKVTYKF